MTVAINYRRDIYDKCGIDEPGTWEDLKDPDIAQDLAINVPGAGAGLNAMLSINHAYGGDRDGDEGLLPRRRTSGHSHPADRGANRHRGRSGCRIALTGFSTVSEYGMIQYDITEKSSR